MCKKTNYKIPNPRIDKCMRSLVSNIKTVMNKTGWETVASCCGHGKYPMSLIVKMPSGLFLEIFDTRIIPRKRNFYKRDKQGYYYIPEVIKN